MTPKEFTILSRTILNGKLSPIGFHRQGDLFYLRKSPNILVLSKNFYKESFTGFYISMTHDFLGAPAGANELALSSFLEDYPYSISIDDLESQYRKFRSVNDFDYDTNFMTRVVLATRTESSNAFPMYDKIRHDEHLARAIVNSVADKVIEFAPKLLDEYSPSVSYKSVTRHRKAKAFILERFKNQIVNYCAENNITLHKKAWFTFLKRK